VSRTFLIPVAAGRPPALVFPSRCVNCGAPPESESALVVARLAERDGEQVEVTFRYAVPHCRRCASATRALFVAGMIPFLAGFAVAGVAAFVTVAADASPLDTSPTGGRVPSLVLGGAAGLTAGLLGGSAAELLARLLLWPVWGRAIAEAPLLIRQFFDDSDHVAGVTARPNRDASQLWLTLRNDEVARDFASLNARVLAGGDSA
jgi:hypothetical protein